ncbi:MAG: RNA polymerase sigma factor [Acidimicrobiales bacterium]|jgi:RNA polymerase sigma-70 factor (ECF subfamily)
MGTTSEARTDAQHIEASFTDPDAFAILFERHALPLQRYMVTRVGRGDAEDLAGETFATAFRARRSYDLGRADARPWLFGIATNLAHHHWRAEGRRAKWSEASLAAPDAEDQADEVASRIVFQSHRGPIGTALGQIDPAALDVLLLVAGPGFSYEEVSVALGIPVGTVRSRLSRARSRLRELLGDSGQYLDEASADEHAPTTTKGTP